jgi:hypothetical protein
VLSPPDLSVEEANQSKTRRPAYLLNSKLGSRLLALGIGDHYAEATTEECLREVMDVIRLQLILQLLGTYPQS